MLNGNNVMDTKRGKNRQNVFLHKTCRCLGYRNNVLKIILILKERKIEPKKSHMNQKKRNIENLFYVVALEAISSWLSTSYFAGEWLLGRFLRLHLVP
jgi:hypothetical protein